MTTPGTKGKRPKQKKLTNDIITLGIMSHKNDYRVCWSLNTFLGYHLERTTDVVGVGGSTYACFAEQTPEYSIRLISNRCEDCYLQAKYSKIDYFLTYDTPFTPEQLQNLMQRIRQIEYINAVCQLT